MPDYNLNDWQDVERAERNVSSWLRERIGGEIRSHLAAAAVLAPLALVATLGTAVGLGFLAVAVLGRPLRQATRGVEGMELLWLGCMALGLLVVLAGFPFQYLRWRRSQTAVSMHGGGVEVDDDRHRPVFLVPTADARESDWDFTDILLFPATLAGMAAQHLVAARQLTACDPALTARVLTLLAHEGRRVSLHDLEMRLGDAGLPRSLRALRHWPGVLWFVRDQVTLGLNDDLRREIARQGGWRS
jgi:hypothetical protein